MNQLCSQFTVASFTIYILAYKDNVLSAQVAFVSLSLVGSLTKPFANLPNGVASFAQVRWTFSQHTFSDDIRR